MLLHLAFIAFVSIGGLLAARWRWITWVHLPALAWGVLAMALELQCPLTALEKSLRASAGQAEYSGDFFQHYLRPLIYSGAHDRALQISLVALLFAGNA